MAVQAFRGPRRTSPLTEGVPTQNGAFIWVSSLQFESATKTQREQGQCSLSSRLVVNKDGREMLRQKEEEPGQTRRSGGQPKDADDASCGLVLPLLGQLPSGQPSQKEELARVILFSCTITQVTMYLNRFPSLVNWLKVCSTTLFYHYHYHTD